MQTGNKAALFYKKGKSKFTEHAERALHFSPIHKKYAGAVWLQQLLVVVTGEWWLRLTFYFKQVARQPPLSNYSPII